jgi:hypothetical protein
VSKDRKARRTRSLFGKAQEIDIELEDRDPLVCISFMCPIHETNCDNTFVQITETNVEELGTGGMSYYALTTAKIRSLFSNDAYVADIVNAAINDVVRPADVDEPVIEQALESSVTPEIPVPDRVAVSSTSVSQMILLYSSRVCI